MKNDYTDVTILLDKSGSMEHLTSDTIGGFNSLLDEQRKQPGELKVTLLQFPGNFGPEIEKKVMMPRPDYIYPMIYVPTRNIIRFMDYTYLATDIKRIKNLTKETYKADGPNTPLFDYLGKLIQETGERFAKMKEKDRPSKVLFIIITDGIENASETFTKSQVNDMIEHQKEQYSWDVSFIGAGGLNMEDAEKSYGESVTRGGIQLSAHNTAKGFARLGQKIVNYRSVDRNNYQSDNEYNAVKTASLTYTNEEKAELKS